MRKIRKELLRDFYYTPARFFWPLVRFARHYYKKKVFIGRPFVHEFNSFKRQRRRKQKNRGGFFRRRKSKKMKKKMKKLIGFRNFLYLPMFSNSFFFNLRIV